MMKFKNILWLLAGLFLISACADNGIDDENGNKTDPEKPEVKEHITFKDDYIRVPASGNTVKLVISTNIKDIQDGDLQLSYIDQNKMIERNDKENSGSASTRAAGKGEDETYSAEIPVLPNENAHSRSSMFVAYYKNDKAVADTIYLIQDGAGFSTSTDFSKDGEVTLLQKHTTGSGIPIIIMGDAFGDKDVNGGTYETTMRKAMDNLFTEQPMTALKEYFDVYMVTVVSKHNDVGLCYDTKLQTVMPSDGTTEVSGDDDAVQDYAEKVVKKYNFTPEQYNNSLIIVILNNNNYAGTCYFYSSKKGEPLNFSIAYCPVIGGLDDDYFRRVLVHESIGHGFAKLADEYSYDDKGAATSDIKQEILSSQSYGWFMNVSTSQTSLPWADFAGDAYYDAKPEEIGAYEGAYGYNSGVWRPSDESIMNSNTNHFNAPSRKLIYDKVLEHNGQTASEYADFKAFDQKNYPDFSSDTDVSSKSRSALRRANRPFAKPKFRTMR